jgi:hypothetical protein
LGFEVSDYVGYVEAGSPAILAGADKEMRKI